MLERLLHWLRRRTTGSRPALTREEVAERKRVLERRYEQLKRAQRSDVDRGSS